MPGPVAKPASTRARRNRSATRAMLVPVANPTIPKLPGHTEWRPAVVQWWEDAWSSPMAPEWTDADEHILIMAAQLMQTVYDPDTSPTPRVTAAAEVRLLLRDCGLTPMARRSLQWEIERGEAADARTSARRPGQKPREVSAPDPREGMAG